MKIANPLESDIWRFVLNVWKQSLAKKQETFKTVKQKEYLIEEIHAISWIKATMTIWIMTSEHLIYNAEKYFHHFKVNYCFLNVPV